MKLCPLETAKYRYRNSALVVMEWKKSLPFFENSRGVLIHRPRTVAFYKLGKYRTHLAIGCWCGNSMSGGEKFTFLETPSDDAILCKRCEENAVKALLPSAYQIAGRHVHTGGVVAIRNCCNEAKP